MPAFNRYFHKIKTIKFITQVETNRNFIKLYKKAKIVMKIYINYCLTSRAN
jgi:hypothetical protein